MNEKTKRKFGPYSVGTLNKTVDLVFHPLAKGKAKIPVIVLDSLVHAAIEQNPGESLRKFLRYNLKKLVEP